MAEEDNKLYAVRVLERGADGLMYVRFADEKTGELLDDDELKDYDIRGFDPDFSGDEEEEDQEDDNSDSVTPSSRPEPKEEEEQSDSPNQGSVSSGSKPTGPWDTPYTGPNQSQFMTNLQQSLGNYLKDSRAMGVVNSIASRTGRVTDKISNAMRGEAARREELGINDPGYIPPNEANEIDSFGVEPTAPVEQGQVSPELSTARPDLPGVDEVPPDDFDSVFNGTPTPEGGIDFDKRFNENIEDIARDNPYVEDVFKDPFESLQQPIEPTTSGDLGANPAQAPDGIEQLYGDEIPSELSTPDARGKETFGDAFDKSVGMNPQMTPSTSEQIIDSVAPELPSGGPNRHTRNLGQSELEAIESLANDLGLSTAEVAGIIGTETADSFDPTKTNKFGYQGTIQFGPEEQRVYGMNRYGKTIGEMTFEEQLEGPVRDYLADRGFRKGMSAEQMYTTIHAGNPHVGMNRRDFANGLTTGAIYNKYVAPRIQSVGAYLRDVDNSGLGRTTPSSNPMRDSSYSSYSPDSFTDRNISMSGGNLHDGSDGITNELGFNSRPISENTAFGFSSPRFTGTNSSRDVSTNFVDGFNFTDNNISGSSDRLSSTGFTQGRSTPSREDIISAYTQNADSRSQQTSSNPSDRSDGNNAGNTSNPGGRDGSSNPGSTGGDSNQRSNEVTQDSYDRNDSISDWNDSNSWF